jgi:formamidopyrimidine-DNA glycosylase
VPELPEVETIKRDLTKALIGKKIIRADILWPKTVAPLSPTDFQSKIKNTKITELERRAKMIRIKLSGPLDLLIHLKMTGQLVYKNIAGGHPDKEMGLTQPSKYTRLTLTFSDKSQLFYNDLRKFGWVRLASDEVIKNLFSTHGPEPLQKDFSLKYFQSLLKKYPNRPIKQILLDQTLIAGIGNI